MEICHLSFLNSFYFKAVPSTQHEEVLGVRGGGALLSAPLGDVRNGHGLVEDLGNESIRPYLGLGDRSVEALPLLSHLTFGTSIQR